MGRGLPRAFLLTVAVLSEAGTISPGFAVPEASTTSLVLPADGGLKGAGPDDDAAFSQGFGGAATQSYKIVGNSHASLYGISNNFIALCCSSTKTLGERSIIIWASTF